MQRKLLVIVFACCSFLAFAQKQKVAGKTGNAVVKDTVKTDYKMLGAPLPDLKVLQVNGKLLTSHDLDNDASLMIMIFNPLCEHCEDVTEELKQNIALFKKTKLVLMTAPESFANLDYFEAVHKVSEYPTMIVGIDSSDFLHKTFIYQSLPQINIYDRNRKLERIFTGDVPVDSLKRYIE